MEMPQKSSRQDSSGGSPRSGSTIEKSIPRSRKVTILDDDKFGVWKWNLKYTSKALGSYECVMRDTGTVEQKDESMVEIVSTIDDEICENLVCEGC